MPVGFLTDEQRYAYGRFNGEPTADQLARYFHLDDTDRKLISNRRADHNRLGFAVQLCTVRFLGVFLENLSETPPGIVAYLGHQLGIKDTGSFSTYCASEARWDHAAKIRSHCGFREFSEPQVQFRLNRWLYALCWTGTDRPSVLFDRAIAWLLTHKVLLPGATVLERCVARVRSRTQERVWGQLTRQISEATKTKLENLLVVPEDGHRSLLDRLRLDTDKLIPNKRFVKKQQMQWTLRGAHLLLRTRTKVLNEDLDEVFRHWYPKFRPQPQTQEPELKAA